MNKINPYRIGCSTLETVISEIALPASLLSLSGTGNIVERIGHGVYNTGQIIYYGVTSAVGNHIPPDTIYSIMSGVGTMGKNLKEDYATSITALLLSYVLLKSIPTISKYVRTNHLEGGQ